MLKPISQILNSLLILIFIGAWGSVVYYSKAAPDDTLVATPTSTIVNNTPTARSIPTPARSRLATADAIPNPNWSQLEPGLERRVIPIYNAND